MIKHTHPPKSVPRHKQDGFSVSEGCKPNTFVKDVSSLLKEGIIFVRTREG